MKHLNPPRKFKNAVEIRKLKKPADMAYYLGRADGTISGTKANFVYVTDAQGQVKQVFNDVIPAHKYGVGIPVKISKMPKGRYWQIDGFAQVFDDPVVTGIKEHADTHSAVSNDPVWVWSDQFMPWLVVPSGLTLQIYRMAFYNGTSWEDALTETLNLASYVPASGALYVLVEVEPDGDLIVTEGTPVTSKLLLTIANIPAPTDGRQSLCAVRLYAGQTIIKKSGTDKDIYDLRFSRAFSGGAGSGNMYKSIYDPQNINNDAFDLAVHTGAVSARKIEPLKIYPVSGLIVGLIDTPVMRQALDSDPPYARWQHLTSTTLDLTSSVPVSGARWVVIFLNSLAGSATSLSTINGSTVGSKASLTWNDIPGFTGYQDRGTYPLAAVMLEAGQTTIAESDILDLRFAGVDSGGAIPRLNIGIIGDNLLAYGGGHEIKDSGKPISSLLHADGSVVADYLTFDTTPTGTPTAEGTLIWNAERETLDLIMSNGVRYQTGQELFFYAINQTGSTIPDGTCVMFAGSLGASGIIKCTPAISDGTYPAIYIMGIATEEILNGETGRITFFGEVHGYNTSGYAVGDLLYPDPATPGGLTKTAPAAPNLKYAIAVALNSKNNGTILVRAIYTMGLHELDDVTTTSPTTGDALVRDGPVWKNFPIYADTFAPNGWQASQIWSKATVDVVSTTKLRITISASSNLTYYWRGVKKNLGATSLQVTSTADKAEGIWYCYSTDGTNFVLTQTPFYIFDMISGAIRVDLMVWEFYWDNTNNVALWIQPEFHASTWNRAIHGYCHEAFGTRYANGLDITYGTTYANNDTRIKLTSGEIHDEDISGYITHSATPTAIWEQILGSAGTADANFAALSIYYLSGATPVWRKVTASSYPFLPVSNNYIYYNRLNAGSYDYTTSIGANDFVVYWVVGTTNQSEPIVIIPGRTDHANLTTAQAEAFPSLSTLFTEYKLLYRIIYQTAGAGNTNNGKCKIALVTDYRKDAVSNSAAQSANLSAALVSFTPSGNIAATNVQAAIEELDTEKAALLSPTFTGTPAAPTAAADTNTTQLATTAFYCGQIGTANPAMDGTAAAGTSKKFSPIDHVHPTDTSLTPTDGWIAATAWTYASASTFTVSGDLTTTYTKGTRIKWTQTSVKYGVVVSSSYSAGSGLTTVTIAVNTDYTIANASISSNFFSYAANPRGYPTSFNYSPTMTTYPSTSVTIGNGVLSGFYSMIGNRVRFQIYFKFGSTTNWNSGTGALLFTLPVTAAASDYDNANAEAFPAYLHDASVGLYVATGVFNSTTKVALIALGSVTGVNPTSPFTFATNDVVVINGEYTAA